MPTYNYKCNNCGIEFAVFQSINDKKHSDCNKCNTRDSIERLITGGTGMIFKGDGFYLTDYTNYGKKDKKELNIKKDKIKNGTKKAKSDE